MADWLARYFVSKRPNATVTELGCGIGNYARHLATGGYGLRWVDCSDGNPTIEAQTRGLCITRNLVQPQDDLPRADFAYSLEVAEHIPKRFEEELLKNLDRANKRGLVLSWSNSICVSEGAGQHVNCRSVPKVIALMRARGYAHEPEAQAKARAAVKACRSALWLVKTLMVFSR